MRRGAPENSTKPSKFRVASPSFRFFLSVFHYPAGTPVFVVVGMLVAMDLSVGRLFLPSAI
jgi:uncharacterized integral membrane protein